MRYWCLVTSKDNWKICKNNNVWGMDYRYYITLKNFLKKGDKAIVYVHGGNFTAEIEIESVFYYDDKPLGWTKKKGKETKEFLFPYRNKIKIIKEGELHISTSIKEEKDKADHFKSNPIDKISFIADKGKTWNIYFQVSILSIPKEDFEFISRELK